MRAKWVPLDAESLEPLEIEQTWEDQILVTYDAARGHYITVALVNDIMAAQRHHCVEETGRRVRFRDEAPEPPPDEERIAFERLRAFSEGDERKRRKAREYIDRFYTPRNVAARGIDCPKCGALAEQECISQQRDGKGQLVGRTVTSFHQERIWESRKILPMTEIKDYPPLNQDKQVAIFLQETGLLKEKPCPTESSTSPERTSGGPTPQSPDTDAPSS